MNRFLAGTVVALAIVSFASCNRSSGPQLHDLSGTVTFNGEPVKLGKMTFVPNSQAGNAGPAGHAEIGDGRFDTRRNGRGTVGGPHIVYIEGYGEPQMRFDADAGGNVTIPTRLFSVYEQRVELPASRATMDFDVPASATQRTR